MKPSPTPHNHKKWGIIGDGQLARMLALAAYPLGIRPVLLTSDPNSSAGQVCPLQVRGSIHSRTDLHLLLSQVDFAVIESEFVNCDTLEATGLSHKVIPGISCIRTLQNKLEQKKLLNRLAINTSSLYEQRQITSLWLDQLLEPSHPQVVLKFATLGYDGKGVCILSGEPGDRKKAEGFCALAADRNIEVYAEDRVDFAQEVAMVAVRGNRGEFSNYPLAVSEQRNGICHRVTGPARLIGINPSLEVTARNWCQRIGDELGIVGAFAVEFFVTKDTTLVVNEIAPRVHNSGHYTQNLACASQFENHWRACAGLQLGPTDTEGYFAMQNLLGPSGLLSKETANAPSPTKSVQSHWYGKLGISPGRKLGHLNVSASNHSDFLASLNHLNEVSMSWEIATRERIPPSDMELPG